jgi:hypothetical protein
LICVTLTRFVLINTLAAACLALWPATAKAQSPLESGGWIVSPLLGITFDPDADPSLNVAVAAGYPLTPTLAIEGELGHVFDMAPDDRDVDSSLTTVHAALVYFFESDYVVVPYVAGGLGLGRFSHQVTRPPASIDATEVGFNLGGGITLPVADRAWFRGDFRYFKHIDEIPSTWRFSAGVVLTVSD